KRKGKTIHTEEDAAPARGSNVIDLMAALKRSIEKPGAKESGGGGSKASSGGAKKAPAKPAASKPAAKKAPAKAAPARKRA
ncbi:MAG TPA: Ku protein, partial [Allosphingosinicella sp.]